MALRLQPLIARHAALAYFALTIALSWGGILLVVGPTSIPGNPQQFDRLFPAVYLAMLVGPTVAGLLLTGLVHGRAGFRELGSRLLRWRVAARWYAIALLGAPLLVLAVLASLSLFSREFDLRATFAGVTGPTVLFGLGVGLGAGIFEEIGWTGFGVPCLRRRLGWLATGLLVGFIWGAWHFLANLWGLGDSPGTLPPAIFLLVALFSFLPPYRVLMVWVYEQTGSLLIAMLMHASLTASLLILGPRGMTGAPALNYDLAFGGVLWLAVAAQRATRTLVKPRLIP